MQASWQRTKELIGSDGLIKLKATHVCVFGCGGVGSFVLEALVRSGIGELSIVDYDVIDISNLNRQVMSDHSNLHQLKVDVLAKRLTAINPELRLHTYPIRYNQTSDVPLDGVDVVVDAMDDVQAKLHLMKTCQTRQLKLYMALATARRLDPTQLIWTDLFSIEADPLARKLKALARKEGLATVEVISSKEKPHPTRRDEAMNKVILGSMIFVPATAGLWLAHRIIQHVLQDKV